MGNIPGIDNALARRGAEFMPYGPAGTGVRVAALVENVELEYAALRGRCVLFDEPQRGFVQLTGSDRLDFLHRMITQAVKDLTPGRAARSFWLNRKGRLEADLTVLHTPERTLLETDALCAPQLAASLSEYLFAEDAAIREASDDWHKLSLHGPRAWTLLAPFAEDFNAAPPLDTSIAVDIGGTRALAYRQDLAGEPGLGIVTSAEDAANLFEALLNSAGEVGVRPGGWHAFNAARIEAGTALWPFDFGPEHLPHDTPYVADRVSMTKGCYLGQEIVARMHSRGHKNAQLAGLLVNAANATGEIPPPGAAVLDADHEPIGHVTSATLSPMLSGATICIARLNQPPPEPGTVVRVSVDGPTVEAVVQPSLVFWTRR